jgi:hypothetical protein
VNSLLYYTKVPTIDMKVMVYSNFSHFFINEIPKPHEEWKISPSQVQGQGSKNRSSVHPFSQNAKPISKLPHNTKK